MQAIASFAVSVAVALACGHRAGLALLIALSVGTLVWIAVAVPYYLRARGKRDKNRRAEDRRALLSGVAGFVLPIAVAIIVWRVNDFDGQVFDTQAAAFAGVTVAIIPISILASSMVDWYLILPFVYGLFGPPVWRQDDDALPPMRRRRYAKIWAAHRAICEICVYLSLALVLSIIFVAVGNAVSDDNTLPVAIQSLGGAGIAFSVLTYLGPRVRHALDYVLGQNAGLGTWASGTDNYGEPVHGLVVDVSIHPGVKLMRSDKLLRYAPLAIADRLQEAESTRPAQCDEAWSEQATREGRQRKNPDPPQSPDDE